MWDQSRLVWSLLDVTFDLCAVLPQEAKKRYDKETEKYYSVLEKHLSLSSRRKEAQLQEVENSAPPPPVLLPADTCLTCTPPLHTPPPTPQADSQVEAVRQQFYQVSLDYVFKVQEVQERKMFDFVEPVSHKKLLLLVQVLVLVHSWSCF